MKLVATLSNLQVTHLRLFRLLVPQILSSSQMIMIGDALVCIWRSPSESSHDKTVVCVAAARAAIAMQAAMHRFTAEGVTLTLHSGLAAGRLTETHFGGHKDRWEYVVAGQPILDTGVALECAKKGEAVVHSSMWSIGNLGAHCEAATIVGHDHMRLIRPITPSPPPTPDLLTELLHFASMSRGYYYFVTLMPALAVIPMRCLISYHSAECEAMLRCYVPQPVLGALRAGKEGLIGELRQVTILFINLPDFNFDTYVSTPYSLFKHPSV
jgi:hypothetical protein